MLKSRQDVDIYLATFSSIADFEVNFRLAFGPRIASYTSFSVPLNIQKKKTLISSHPVPQQRKSQAGNGCCEENVFRSEAG